MAVNACGSHSDPPRQDVPALCHEVIGTLCSTNQACSVASGETQPAQGDQFIANCKAGASTTLDCSRKTEVTGNVDACQMDMLNMPCSLYMPPNGLPFAASCRNIFK